MVFCLPRDNWDTHLHRTKGLRHTRFTVHSNAIHVVADLCDWNYLPIVSDDDPYSTFLYYVHHPFTWLWWCGAHFFSYFPFIVVRCRTYNCTTGITTSAAHTVTMCVPTYFHRGAASVAAKTAVGSIERLHSMAGRRRPTSLPPLYCYCCRWLAADDVSPLYSQWWRSASRAPTQTWHTFDGRTDGHDANTVALRKKDEK